MGIHIQRIPKHWNYFLCIEEDILALSRWIEFAEENFGCYSLELARLLMVCASEVDVVAKALCRRIQVATAASSINRYQALLIEKYPTLPSNRVGVPRFGLTLTPWGNWSKPNSPPLWWTANNKVKHHRSEHFNEASLQNVLNSAAGLFVLLVLYYGLREASIAPASQLFEPDRIAFRDGSYFVFRNQG